MKIAKFFVLTVALWAQAQNTQASCADVEKIDDREGRLVSAYLNNGDAKLSESYREAFPERAFCWLSKPTWDTLLHHAATKGDETAMNLCLSAGASPFVPTVDWTGRPNWELTAFSSVSAHGSDAMFVRLATVDAGDDEAKIAAYQGALDKLIQLQISPSKKRMAPRPDYSRKIAVLREALRR